MMEKALSLAAAWWRARTERERSLLSIGAALVLGVLLPALAYQAAARYREHGAVALAEAREIESNVELLASAPRIEAASGGDGSLRAGVFAIAQAQGLTISQATPIGADRLSVTLAPAESLRAYRWMDAVGRRGWMVTRTRLQRSGEGDLVSAEFEVAASP